MIIRLAILLFICFAPKLLAQNVESNNEVIIIGKRKMQSQIGTYGQVKESGLEKLSDQDVTEQLKSEASISQWSDSRPSFSGYRIPSIRGLDARNTEIYLDEFLLFDPYSGLSLLSDLNIRAFESFRIYKGMPPRELQGSASLGAIQFVFPQTLRNRIGAGMSYGDINGSELHSKWDHVWSDKNLGSRIFLSGGKSSGKYSYYSDNGTPFEESDDGSAMRQDNQSSFTQALPYLYYDGGSYSIKFFSLFSSRDQGVPLRADIESDATAKMQKSFSGVSISKNFNDVFDFNLSGVIGSQQSLMRDPKGYVLLVPSVAKQKLFTNGLKSSLEAHLGFLNPYFNVGIQDSRFRSSRLSDERSLTRQAFDTIVGSEFFVLDWLRFDLRRGFTQLTDTEASSSLKRGKNFNGVTTRIGPENFGIYFQYAKLDRAPTLLEEFGDGVAIQENPNLENEMTTHREFGINLGASDDILQSYLAVFKDNVQKKIVFLPTSSISDMAVHLDETETVGFEFGINFEADDFDSTLSYTRLRAENRSPVGLRVLPKTSEQVAVAGLGYQFRSFHAGWMTRYQSEFYLDEDNSLQYPAFMNHDFDIDKKSRIFQSSLRTSLSVKNIFNVRSSQISSRDGRVGRTAIKDSDGYPLPGRSIVAAVEIEM